MSLKDTLKKFTDGIADITNLEVTTYTGTLEQAVNKETGKIRWEDFKPDSGELVLVAATLVRPNHDTVNFRAQEAEHGQLSALFELHAAATESATAGRVTLVKMLLGLRGTSTAA
ncbi:MAG: hypothetical protein U0441_26055 [Polyangiaceae bacterium]